MKQEPITLKYIIQLMMHHKKALIYGQLFTLLIIAISVPIPLMLPIMVNEVLLHKPSHIVHTINALFGSGSAFYYIGIVALVVIFLRFIFFILNVITTKIFTKISKYVTFEIRQRLIKHLKSVSMNEYEMLGSGAITANLITDVNTLDTFIIASASKLVTSILTLLAVGVVMVLINPLLGVMILIIQPLIMLVSKKMSKHVGKLKKEENETIEEFQDNIGQTLDLFGQIKASNKENYFFDKAVFKADAIQKTSNEYGYKSVVYERLSNTIFLIFFELLRASGLLLVVYSDLSIGMMLAMFGYIWFIMTPVQDLFSIQYSYSAALAAIKRLNKILLLQRETNGTTLISSPNLDISIKNLSFSYTADQQILQDISFDIPYGSKIALIGASGSGKTTLAQIIAGFYEKSGGELLYNGFHIEQLDKSSLRQRVFLILQMPILFNATLRFNITMGATDISDEEIYKALEIAQLSDTIHAMPSKLDTVVGRHGIKLSGGQRQRISIARMIIADPSVVIFDESTSALDVYTETKLYSALEPLLHNKTVITIAHRLSTVKNADMIYVLDNQRIVQRGTHEALENQEGHYMEFIKNQLV
jgi:ATP-binding cassette, subfamily C, bacterial